MAVARERRHSGLQHNPVAAHACRKRIFPEALQRRQRAGLAGGNGRMPGSCPDCHPGHCSAIAVVAGLAWWLRGKAIPGAGPVAGRFRLGRACRRRCSAVARSCRLHGKSAIWRSKAASTTCRNPAQRRTRFRFRVDGDASQPEPLRGKLLQISWYDDFDAREPGPRTRLRAGARWKLNVQARAPRGLSNPGGFDSERNALAQRIAATGYVRAPGLARELDARAGRRWLARTHVRPHRCRDRLDFVALRARAWRWATRAASTMPTGKCCVPPA